MSIQDIKKNLDKIQQKYQNMQFIYFDNKGKVIAQGNKYQTVYKSALNKIKRNIGQYEDKYLVEFNLSFYPSQINKKNMDMGDSLDKKPKGPILLETLVHTVKVLPDNKLSLQSKNHCSKIRLYFLPEEIVKFSSGQIKKLVKVALKGETRNRMYYYYYSELLE